MSEYQSGSCNCHDTIHSDSCLFWTRKEKVSMLEQRLEELREEVKATEERIGALKGEEGD
jgi:hypothetical protein